MVLLLGWVERMEKLKDGYKDGVIGGVDLLVFNGITYTPVIERG